ncbi:MAG: hypothetical protein KHY46_07960 [Clostridiales bacterium]|uniref:MarR family transcriptional regulator n=1 Tax=Enterocloster sp. TaxID=2719315 RepID=UPI00174E7A58|nr:hypothetical protein [Clostridiales bacterium]
MADDKTDYAGKVPIKNLSVQQRQIIDFIKKYGKITSRQTEEVLGIKQRRARTILKDMAALNILERQGSYKSTAYILKEREKW